MSTNKQYKLSTQNSKKSSNDKVKLDKLEKKRVNSKSKLSNDMSRHCRNSSEIGKLDKSASRSKLNKSSNNVNSSSNIAYTQGNSSSKATDAKKQISRNDKEERRSKIEEYHKLMEHYKENKFRNDLKEPYNHKDLINKSLNLNYLKTECKGNDSSMSNLNNSVIFRTQNKSNASFLGNFSQINDKSFSGNLDSSPIRKNIKSYKLTDLLNSRFAIPCVDYEDKFLQEKPKKEKFPVIEDITNHKHIANNISPLKANEFTFDKTFGKNSDIPQKLVVSKDNNMKNSYNKERNMSPIDDTRKHGKSPSRLIEAVNASVKVKEKGIKIDQSTVLDHNISNTPQVNIRSSYKLNESKEFRDDKNQNNKNYSKLHTDFSSEVKKMNNHSNDPNYLRASITKNQISSMKDKNLVQSKDKFKSKEDVYPDNHLDKNPSPERKSEMSNKNSVFTSVNSGNYVPTKNSTNDSKTLFGVKMNEPESIEEMHYLYVKFHQKTKKMMSSQESLHTDKNKVFMFKTVVAVDEIDIE